MTAADRLRWFVDTLLAGGGTGEDLQDIVLPHMHQHLPRIREGIRARALQVAGAEIAEIEERGPYRAVARLRTPSGEMWTAATSIEREAPHRVQTIWCARAKPRAVRDTIDTPRLHLRPLQDGDLEPFIEMEADPEVMRWVGLGGAQDRTAAMSSFEFFVWLWERGLGGFAVTDRETGVFLGRAFLGPLLDEIEVGYGFVRGAWGRGIATEAARAVVEWGFEELSLRRIIGITYPDNLASQAVLRKCGMTQGEDLELMGRMFRYFARDADTARETAG